MDEIDRLGPEPQIKKSRLSITLLENFMLALSIMSNIAQKFIKNEDPSDKNRRIYELAFRE